MDESIIHYTTCPVCGAAKLEAALYAKDYTVSGKTFDIEQCSDCSLRFTQDVPDASTISPYYQSPDYISHTDSSEGLINRIYHFVRKRTLNGKRNLVVSELGLKTGSLLDIGSGTGAFVHHMQQHGWQSTGLEPDDTTRQRASTLYNLGLKPTEALFEIPEHSFDAITMWHVLEHVHELHGYMAQLKKIVKPSGRIFIAVPNYTAYDARIYGAYWAAYDVPRHLYHFSPDAIKKLLAIHGLRLESIKPMWYDGFYISFLSEKYRKGNLLRGFIIAMIANLKALLKKERCSSLIYVISKP
jgi:2-polyprenyl-3-methyl-5-hydroxy-6-metoxy-1,4-benzoquinol methylase